MNKVFCRCAAVLSILFGLSSPVHAAESAMPQLVRQSTQPPTVSIHIGTGKIRLLAAPAGDVMRQPDAVAADADAESAARAFIGTYGRLFGLRAPERELTVIKTAGRTVKFRQVYHGLPVIAGELVVNLDAAGNVRSINGEISPDISIGTAPTVSAKTAKAKAVDFTAKREGVDRSSLSIAENELSVYNPVLLGEELNRNFLVWRFEVRSDNGMVRELVLVDAMTGMPLLGFNQVDSARNRSIYDNQNNPYAGLPGFGPYRTEGQGATGVADIDNAYDYLGDTYDFYSVVHSRNSIDNAGMPLIATVRYCDPSLPAKYCPYANAFWNGEQMVFGQGFAAADDVVGHELTHGVTERESGLYYFNQSGAINESLSDVWGEFIDLTNGQGTDTPEARWLMGEDVPGMGAIRSMSNPPKFSDPDSMLSSLYSCKAKDNGGVHTNSGVNNKAAYLMVDGGTFGGLVISGVSGASDLERIQKVAKLYYKVQTDYLTSGSDFLDLGDYLIQACDDLQLSAVMSSNDCKEVEKAVRAVRMFSLPSKCRSGSPPLCVAGSPVMPMVFSDDLENTSSGNWSHSALSGTDAWAYPQNPNIFPYWTFDATYATSGTKNFYAYDLPYVSDYQIGMTASRAIPANAFMVFNQSYDFDMGKYLGKAYYFDGGIVEYSTNNGASWNDAAPLFMVNGYDHKLYGKFQNPLGGRAAFAGSSRGYIRSKLDLSSLAGQNVRFRFRMATDNSVDYWGWFIDDIMVYTCSSPAPSSVVLDNPTGGETFRNGERVTIDWTAPKQSANYSVFYSLDNGATWKAIDKNLQTQSIDWDIPLMSKNRTKVKVKVNAYDDAKRLISSARSGAFTIEVVKLNSPDGGETWDEGTSQTISWSTNTTTSPVSKALLSYTTDGGATWKGIGTDMPSDGAFDWILPQVRKDTKAKVKVVLKDALGNTVGSDISNETFTIVNIP